MEKAIDMLLAALATSPLTLTFAYMWWSERDERRAMQAKLEAINARVEKALIDATQALSSIVTGSQSTHSLINSLKDMLLMLGGRGFPMIDAGSERPGDEETS